MPKTVETIGGIKIYQEDNALIYVAGMAIDADGDEMAYGPPGTTPLDYIGNAGSPGNWWGITTDSRGEPYVQKSYHRAPGYYVSSTSLENPAFPSCNPDRFLDSSAIPFFVLPSNFGQGVRIGDLGFAVNTQTKDNNFMIYGDVGPNGKIGEGSINLAHTLGLNANPKSGGTEHHIICYWLVPGSGKGWQPVDTWYAQANKVFNAWGGVSRLQTILDAIT
jgi:hypothetical protein